jgi:hypothetical protein
MAMNNARLLFTEAPETISKGVSIIVLERSFRQLGGATLLVLSSDEG